MAVAGDPIESWSTTPFASPSVPALPADVTMRKSGLFHMNSSTASEFDV